MVEPFTKLVPVIVKRNAAVPAVLLDGERLVVAGIGLFTVKLSALLVPPPGPGFVTVTGITPAVLISVVSIIARTSVELTKSAVWFVPPKLMVAPLTKFVPLIFRRNAGSPTTALVGSRLVRAGIGLLTDNVTGAEGPLLD